MDGLPIQDAGGDHGGGGQDGDNHSSGGDQGALSEIHSKNTIDISLKKEDPHTSLKISENNEQIENQQILPDIVNVKSVYENRNPNLIYGPLTMEKLDRAKNHPTDPSSPCSDQSGLHNPPEDCEYIRFLLSGGEDRKTGYERSLLIQKSKLKETTLIEIKNEVFWPELSDGYRIRLFIKGRPLQDDTATLEKEKITIGCTLHAFLTKLEPFDRNKSGVDAAQQEPDSSSTPFVVPSSTGNNNNVPSVSAENTESRVITPSIGEQGLNNDANQASRAGLCCCRGSK